MVIANDFALRVFVSLLRHQMDTPNNQIHVDFLPIISEPI